MKDAEQEIASVYDAVPNVPLMEDYYDRHGIESLVVLTITSAYAATREVDQFASRIRGKTVVEIGAGVGFLAMEMARFAKQVYAIEADPAWNHVFTECLYALKPPNLTWIFGAAQSVAPILRGDVAVVYTRSDREGMLALARQMCPEVINGPLLGISEHEPNATPEELEAVRRFARTVTLDDVKSRRGFGTEREVQDKLGFETT